MDGNNGTAVKSVELGSWWPLFGVCVLDLGKLCFGAFFMCLASLSLSRELLLLLLLLLLVLLLVLMMRHRAAHAEKVGGSERLICGPPRSGSARCLPLTTSTTSNGISFLAVASPPRSSFRFSNKKKPTLNVVLRPLPASNQVALVSDALEGLSGGFFQV